MPSFLKKIFKAYDIRGLAEGELSEEIAYKIGRAFAVFLKQTVEERRDRAVVVGRDMRTTSPVFTAAVIDGITAEGLDVVDIGLATTPLFNFACANYYPHMGGIMVTASHNPSAYNGFKMTLHSGLPVGKGGGMEIIAELVEKDQFQAAQIKGGVKTKEVLADYLAKVKSLVDVGKIKPLKIVVDAGNGMAKVTIPKLLEKLPIQVEYLFLEPDGNFPNHEANPLKVETLRDLQKKVVEVGADFGFALDGDADRVGLVDELGQVVDASFVAVLLGLEVLKKHPKSMMLYDLRSSQIIKEVWEKNGANTKMCAVGHALIKKMMKENKAVFASELSLHLYFHDLYDVESPDLCLLYILDLLSRENKPLSELINPFKKYFHSGEINFEVENKEKVMKEVEGTFENEAKEVNYLDGLWMGFDWGFLNIRASNTEPVLRLNLEADTKEKMEKMREKVICFFS